MYYVLALLAHGVITLGVYFVCSWFSKKEYDNWDMMAIMPFLWIMFPFAFIITIPLMI